MTVETVSYISNFNTLWPLDTDGKNEGDDHIREVKNGILGTFSAVAAECRPSHTNLNYLSGLSATAYTRLDALSASIGDQNNRLSTINTNISNISATADTLSVSVSYTESVFYAIEATGSGTTSIQFLNMPADWTASYIAATYYRIYHNFGDTNYAVLSNGYTAQHIIEKAATYFRYATIFPTGTGHIVVARRLTRVRINPVAGNLTYTGSVPTIT